MPPSRFLVARHPTRGRLWACIGELHHGTPGVGETRFGAYLKPFPTEDEARAALSLAGAEGIEAEIRPKRKSRRG